MNARLVELLEALEIEYEGMSEEEVRDACDDILGDTNRRLRRKPDDEELNNRYANVQEALELLDEAVDETAATDDDDDSPERVTKFAGIGEMKARLSYTGIKEKDRDLSYTGIGENTLGNVYEYDFIPREYNDIAGGIPELKPNTYLTKCGKWEKWSFRNSKEFVNYLHSPTGLYESFAPDNIEKSENLYGDPTFYLDYFKCKKAYNTLTRLREVYTTDCSAEIAEEYDEWQRVLRPAAETNQNAKILYRILTAPKSYEGVILFDDGNDINEFEGSEFTEELYAYCAAHNRHRIRYNCSDEENAVINSKLLEWLDKGSVMMRYWISAAVIRTNERLRRSSKEIEDTKSDGQDGGCHAAVTVVDNLRTVIFHFMSQPSIPKCYIEPIAKAMEVIIDYYLRTDEKIRYRYELSENELLYYVGFLRKYAHFASAQKIIERYDNYILSKQTIGSESINDTIIRYREMNSVDGVKKLIELSNQMKESDRSLMLQVFDEYVNNEKYSDESRAFLADKLSKRHMKHGNPIEEVRYKLLVFKLKKDSEDTVYNWFQEKNTYDKAAYAFFYQLLEAGINEAGFFMGRFYRDGNPYRDFKEAIRCANYAIQDGLLKNKAKKLFENILTYQENMALYENALKQLETATFQDGAKLIIELADKKNLPEACMHMFKARLEGDRYFYKDEKAAYGYLEKALYFSGGRYKAVKNYVNDETIFRKVVEAHKERMGEKTVDLRPYVNIVNNSYGW